MITVTITRDGRCPVTNKKITAIVTTASRFEKKIKGQVAVILLTPAAIRRYNYHYRGKNKVTDVLSFAWQEGVGEKSNFIGEVYLCYDKIARQAKDFNATASEEFTRMLTHGLLHLVGYDHVLPAEAKRMFNKQEKIVAAV